VAPVVGDYLKAIYALRAAGEDAYAVTLATLFGVSRAAASATIGRLTRDGLVVTDGRQVLLTASGNTRAEEGIRRHNVTECFLVAVLGMPWAAVHEQARIFERGLTPLLDDRIDERSGYPTACPHGNPVPRAGLNAATFLRDCGAVPLARAPLGERFTVLAVSELAEQHAEWLAQCEDLGLRPRAPVIVSARFGQEVDVQIAGQEQARIPMLLAARVWVVAADSAQDEARSD
jgi:DtxR family Mn-dependent transcriptional regulator